MWQIHVVLGRFIGFDQNAQLHVRSCRGTGARQDKENARLTSREIDKHCLPGEKGATLLKQAISRLGLSARGYHRILKVARTIADLAGVERVADAHVAEAIQYRRFDRM